MTLDDAYDNSGYITGADAYPDRWAAQGQAFRDALGARAQTGVRYGPSPRQTFDFFQPTGVSRGTVMFVHGGYWRRFDASYWSHLAAGPMARGWAVAMPSYDLCPDASIGQIGTQIAAALTKVADRTQGPIALAGHSAGGHLVSRMMDPLVLPEPVRRRIERIAPISPVADLRPLTETSMNAEFRLDEAGAVAESPALQTKSLDVPVSVWVGGEERPALLDQARWLAEAWDAPCHVIPDRHHFDVIDGLMDPDGAMLAAMLS